MRLFTVQLIKKKLILEHTLARYRRKAKWGASMMLLDTPLRYSYLPKLPWFRVLLVPDFCQIDKYGYKFGEYTDHIWLFIYL